MVVRTIAQKTEVPWALPLPPPSSGTLCDFRQIYLVPFSTFSEVEVFVLILVVGDL